MKGGAGHVLSQKIHQMYKKELGSHGKEKQESQKNYTI